MAAGADVVPERIFATMQSMFRPERAQGQDGVVQWDVAWSSVKRQSAEG